MVSADGLPDYLELLLAHSQLQVNLKGEHGYTALHFASAYGNVETVKLLLAHPSIELGLLDEVRCVAYSSQID